MKTLSKAILILTVAIFSSASMFAQEAKVIKLEQTKGEFTVKSLTLSAGDYIFEVDNNGVDHAVGFVLSPKGKTSQENHIKSAYLKSTPKDGEHAQSNVVSLEKGEYAYFCPLNPTEEYTLTVK